MFASVILTTYSHPRWLENILWGFSAQSCHDFEIILADDGSVVETRTEFGIEQALETTAHPA